MKGGGYSRMSFNSPSRIFESRRLSPDAWISTSTSSSCKVGSGISPSRRRPFFLYRSRMKAFIVLCFSDFPLSRTEPPTQSKLGYKSDVDMDAPWLCQAGSRARRLEQLVPGRMQDLVARLGGRA